MTFHNPGYLFLLLLLLPIIYWYIKEMHKSDASLQISSLQDLTKFPKSKRIKMRHLPFILRLFTLIFLIIAIARPQSSNSLRNETTEGIDIMIALDISGTMLAEDLKPNRLEASKAVATEFILSRPNDNIGLVIFAAESFTQCPLTTDHDVLINLFKGVQYGMIEDGTAIGLGLANAVNRIKDGKAKSKVIILLTDGSNNRGDIAPVSAAEIAKTFGIRVYAIGVGSHGMVRVPVPTPLGMQYQLMESEFDEQTLKAIANITGGKYFRATDNLKLRSIYQEIDQLEKTKISVREYSKKNEIFYIFALAAFVCLISEILLRNTVLRKIP
ncbi:MAG: VWA domain-containing protein [Paludibacteraceae bacterium]|jgi:Ca-activated chloride channel family protein|nr:VWA domain-containing protein [Paludibacteraceae bacterium]OPZ01287.1 MAG: von Willebrand factor type A domain protein [Bacteroidetes bacterium ADurb.BinA395]HOF98114.1 VWA domain-containing protein [Paludibacteraceae bacterium]HOR38921.1 VWA domain-containing protein [Paludibacteraceae bacterium]HPD58712.1 VWA domain-containing protein [Paludibacteraceae bacterium]